MTLDDPQDRDVAAGEFVMGSLSAGERREFEQALATDADLQRAVYAWQDRLFDLNRRAGAVSPPPDLWARIEQRLVTLPAVMPHATNDPHAGRVRFWRLVSGLSLAACLMLAVGLVLQGAPSHVERYLAVLQGPDKVTGWVVEVTAGGRVRLVPTGTTPPVPSGKVMQFWTKPDGAAGPTSLGLVPPGQVTELSVAKLPSLGERQLFELTLEPAGGSTIGRPTGPILFVGSTVRL